MRWNIGPFGVKDLFTLVNLLGGIFAVHFVVAGRADASPATRCWPATCSGDTLDGPVARLTKTSNKFGSEFDTATDHFVQGIAPGAHRLRRLRARRPDRHRRRADGAR